MAYCLEQTGELENSVHYYKKFIDEDPYSEYAWYNLGNIYFKLKNYKKSIEAFEFAIAIDEEYSSAYNNLAESYLNLENYELAKVNFYKSLELDGPSPEIYSSIGRACLLYTSPSPRDKRQSRMPSSA